MHKQNPCNLLQFIVFSLLLFLITFHSMSVYAENNTVWLLEINGAIGPASADYFQTNLAQAQQNGVKLVILQLDTPGGLDTAMRDMVQAITTSTVPVITYVAPSGARAASAGTYILYASHIAAMAPGTNLGAATPVRIASLSTENGDVSEEESPDDEKTSTDKSDDTMKNKMVNDAEAYLRSLAQLRGRNAEWAAEAVRESASLSAKDALEKGVIDVIANNVQDLLDKVHGRDVKMEDGTLKQLITTGLSIEKKMPSLRNELLSIISNPNVAYILMLIGIYGIFFELYNPGALFPGVIGGISLLLALYAFQVLPINYAGVALILLGIAFMAAEAFLPSFGVLGIGGITAFIIGSLILIDTDLSGHDIPGFVVSRPLIAGMGVVLGLITIAVINVGLKIHHRPIVSGQEELIGAVGECITADNNQLRVYIHSETWNARADGVIQVGQQVKVVSTHGLLLEVEPLSEMGKS